MSNAQKMLKLLIVEATAATEQRKAEDLKDRGDYWSPDTMMAAGYAKGLERALKIMEANNE
jgi:hypothetical protein